MSVILHESLGEGGERVDVAADAQRVHDQHVGGLRIIAPHDDDDEGGDQVHFGVSIRSNHSHSTTTHGGKCEHDVLHMKSARSAY